VGCEVLTPELLKTQAFWNMELCCLCWTVWPLKIKALRLLEMLKTTHSVAQW